MIRAVDHVVILVNDLAQAAADYSALGFTVVQGGEHTGGASHNMLVAFADGSYFELIAFTRTAPDHTWWRHAALGEGLIDFALLPSEIATDLEAARSRGLALEGPFPGGRQRPDGVQLEWQTGRSPSGDLPFFCADVTPRNLRVPGGDATRHINGVTGIVTLEIAVADIDRSSEHYRAMLGMDGGPAFQLGTTTILLSASPAAQARIAQRGEGPLSLILRVQHDAAMGILDPALTHNVPIALAH